MRRNSIKLNSTLNAAGAKKGGRFPLCSSLLSLPFEDDDDDDEVKEINSKQSFCKAQESIIKTLERKGKTTEKSSPQSRCIEDEALFVAASTLSRCTG